LNATSVTEGTVLKRSGARTNNATGNEPLYNPITQSPTAIGAGVWTNPTNAYTSDDSRASSSTPDNTQIYKNYGLSVPSDAAITKVEIGYEGNTTVNDGVAVSVSRTGEGGPYSSEFPIALSPDEDERWTSVTSAFADWKYWDFSNANWTVKIKHVLVYSENSADPIDTESGGDWANPTGVYTAGDGERANSTLDANVQVYSNFTDLYLIPSDADIIKVEAGYTGYTSGNDKVSIAASKNGGTSYSSEYAVTLPTGAANEATSWTDITGAFGSWSYSDFNATNLRVRIKHAKVDTQDNVYCDWLTIRVTYDQDDVIECDWLPTRVSYSYPWQNPTGAYTLGDGQRANSSLNNYAQVYKGYGFNVDPGAVISAIEVGFRGYTTGDDKVAVSVSRDGGETWGSEVEVILTGTETTYWKNMKFTFPPTPPWENSHFSDGAWRVKVRHKVVGGEDDVYCDWLPSRVTYYFKTTFLQQIWNVPDPVNVTDYVYFYGSLKAPATKGVDGSGTLATVTFLVEVPPANSSDLGLYSVELRNSFGIPITCTTQNGTFRSSFLPDITGPENPPASGQYPPDGYVDGWDMTALSKAYGSTPGAANWDWYCDITGPENPPASGQYPPDDKVDGWDMTAASKDYGKHV